MKKCNDCECIFSEKYTLCPSCPSNDIGNYKTADDRYTEAKDELMLETISAMVEYTPLDDFQG